MFTDETKQLMSDLSTTARRPVNWNVLTPGDPEIVANQLDASDVARKNGGKVVALTVPQPVILRLNLYAGMVFDALIGWAELFQLSIDERIEVLKDPARRIELDISARSGGPFQDLADWSAMIVHATFNPENKHLDGRTVGSIADEQGKAPIDAFFDLAISEGLRTSFIPPAFGGGSDESLWAVRGKLWADERTIIGASDAGAHLDMIDTFAFSTQVLGNGVREYGVIALEKAVQQITEVPAELFGLTERGRLSPGWHADIVIFDPDTIATGPVHVRSDLPTGEPRIYADAVGVEHVFVNGVQIIKDGEHTNARPGTVLRSGVDTYTPSMT
jgi:N-acyl-D-aspartate/D-glutamate deacylase